MSNDEKVTPEMIDAFATAAKKLLRAEHTPEGAVRGTCALFVEGGSLERLIPSILIDGRTNDEAEAAAKGILNANFPDAGDALVFATDLALVGDFFSKLSEYVVSNAANNVRHGERGAGPNPDDTPEWLAELIRNSRRRD